MLIEYQNTEQSINPVEYQVDAAAVLTIGTQRAILGMDKSLCFRCFNRDFWLHKYILVKTIY